MTFVQANRDKQAVAAAQKTKEKDYWLEKLAGGPPVSLFPYESTTPPEGDTHPGIHPFLIEGELFNRLVKISGGADARLHMILVSCLMVLLGRYSRNNDIVIGTPVFTSGKDIQGGLLNAVVPLRNTIDPGFSFKQLLGEVKKNVIDAAENQAYPIDILVEQLGLENGGDHFPLFDVVLALENIQAPELIQSTRPNVALLFNRTGNRIHGRLEYLSSRYDQDFIRQIARHFRTLLENLVFNPDTPLSQIHILDEAEQKQLLFDFNDTAAGYPRDKTIVQLFQERVEQQPGKIAVVYDGEQLTYRQLNEKSNRLAHLLRQKGVATGIVVALLVDRSLELVVSILAVLKAGGAYLPIDPDYPEMRIRSILDESGAQWLMTKEGVIHSLGFTYLKNITGNDDSSFQPVFTSPRTPIQKLDTLPFPDRSLVDYNKYHQYIGIAPVRRSVTIQASRGCPYNCLYCHKIWPKKYISRSAENIYEELRRCYDAGVRDFVFIDDVFNLDKRNSGRLLETIIKDNLDVRLFYPNGLRADILDKDFIDLMVEAGTVNICTALETASPRLQKLIKKNLNIEKFSENVRYIAEKYPHVILEMELMHGFPSETEEEAMMNLQFLKEIKWVDFPNLNILKIFPNTDMYRLAVEHGVSPKAIEASTNFAYHELPETLPVPKRFTRQLQAMLLDEYFLLKERMLDVLPRQMEILTEKELVKKYDTYLPAEIRRFEDILDVAGITPEELGDVKLIKDDTLPQNDFPANIKKYSLTVEKKPEAVRLLLLDLSLFFSRETTDTLYDVTEEPLGLMYLLSHLNRELGAGIDGKIAKSRIDFNSYDELKKIIRDFNPDLIGLRSLSYYREFFHRTVSVIKEWGVSAPIIAGGPYATSDAPIILRDPDIECSVLGEGEQTILEIARYMVENNKQFPPLEILRTIPGIAFCSPGDREWLTQLQRQVLILDTLEEAASEQPVDNPPEPAKPDDLLYMIATSGSTGKPKPIRMPHRALVNLLHFQNERTGITHSKVLQFASMAFDVSFQEIFSALLAGGEIHLVSQQIRSNIPLLLDYVRDHEIETLFLPPAFLKFIFDEPEFSSRFPACVSHIVTAGEQLVVTDPMRQFFKAKNIYLHNHYGPAETHVVTTFTMPPGEEIPHLPPIGKPISNVQIYIIDDSGHPQPIGVPGEMVIAGEAVGQGYHNNPGLTAETFVPNPFNSKFKIQNSKLFYKSGDLAKWLPDGNIQFIGRRDLQVQVRGFRVELQEIETKLTGIEYIKEAVVIDHRDESGEVYLCAYVVLDADDREFDSGVLRDRLSAELPDYMVPSYFVRLTGIPLNSSGKIDKKSLPVPTSGDSAAGFTAPGDEVEKRVAAIWSGVLEKQGPVGIDENFFESGGHSLKGTILISRIHQEFGVKLMLADLFRFPTIRQLARHLRDSGVGESPGDSFESISTAPVMEYYPLSPAQKRLYILQQMNPNATVYNMPMTVVLEGSLDKNKLDTVFQTLVRRHDGLRTSFETVDGKTVQHIHEHIDFEIDHDARLETFIRPFNLEHAPLMRAGLCPVEEGKHLLMVDIHHTVSDAVTLEILIREFAALYRGEEPPPPRVQYKDFSHWQSRLIEKGDMRQQEDFWLRQFKGDIPQLEMPLDFPRPAARSPEGDNRGIHLEETLDRAVKALSKQTGTTLYQLLLAVYFVLLHKYGGQQDIIVGSPISGRRHADLENIVGVFVNMIALRTRPEPGKTFEEFLREVKETVLAAYENQDYPFDQLVTRLGIKNQPARNPLFDAGFLYTSLDTRPIEESTLKITPYNETRHRVSRFDMLMGAGEIDNRLFLGIEFSTQLYKPESIDTFLNHYIAVLRQVTGNPATLLGDIAVSTGFKRLETQKPEIQFNF